MEQMKADFMQIQIERLQELITNVDKRIEKMQKTKYIYLIRLKNKKLELNR